MLNFVKILNCTHDSVVSRCDPFREAWRAPRRAAASSSRQQGLAVATIGNDSVSVVMTFKTKRKND